MSAVCFKFRYNILISGKIIKEMPGSVASGTPYIIEGISLLIKVTDCSNVRWKPEIRLTYN